MSESHLEQLKPYFINLAGDKVDTDFGLDDCQEYGEADVDNVNDEIRNTQADKSGLVEEGEKEHMNDDVDDEHNSEESVAGEEEPEESVGRKHKDIIVSSSAKDFNPNFFIVFFLLLQ